MSVPLTLLGLLERGPSRRYIITEDGVAEVDKWLGEPVPPDPLLARITGPEAARNE